MPFTRLNDTAEHQRAVYRRWAPIYDHVYRGLLRDTHRRVAEAASRTGRRILEVGVGTGLVLPHYPSNCRVTGIDISEHMIARAHLKVAREGLRHVEALRVMDARRLAFADRTFDAVCLPFVITLIPEPERALDECARVLRNGGEIILASKISEGTGLQTAIEEAIAPLVHRVGWSSAFRMEQITGWARTRGDFQVVDIQPLFPGGFFKIVRLRQRGYSS
ncbi:class I SAM-dependent methyltransferase [Rhizobium sp. BK251]|uniref:class I SAM-dependent methyltransferase n=1 Tax=Rhizobium sp. BK251 TaxID=2512125 RepID=UPI00105081B7|nr:class I SAM-dependent methyltransferase [Rhizobium sp. BK251]TCL76062.1 phosphatidylethanolamine/phosphatidyl-N-methylethanolamine N-methyltransferase [Rhizobium sp. BK251]